MTKKDRTNLSILLVLLVVLGATIVLVFGMNGPTTTAAVQTPQAKPSANPPPAASDAKIRLDLVEKSDSENDRSGGKNVFQYREAPLPPPKPAPKSTPVLASGAQPGVTTPPPMPVRSPVPAPAAPPPIPLKYQGFFAVKAPGGGLTAVLADDARHYNVTVGEVLLGRYRIASITDRSVEIEDLEFNRRQMLLFVK